MRRYLWDYFFITVVAVLASTVVPLYLISVQPEEFLHFDIRAFVRISLVIALVLALAGSLLFTVLRVLGAWKLARFLVLFFLHWVAITGFILPVVGSATLVDPAKLDENYLNIVLAAFGALVMAGLALSPRLRAIPFVFLGIFSASTMFTATPVVSKLYAAPDQKAAAQDDVFSISKHANLLVVSLDGIPGHLVSGLLARHAELRAAFQDFYVFDNAVSLAPATVESMLGELYGNRDFRALAKTQEGVLSRLDYQKIPFNRIGGGTAGYTFGFYSRFNTNTATRLDTGDLAGISEADRLIDMVMFLEYSLARMASGRAVRALRKLKVTQYAMEPLVAGYEGELALRLFEHKGPLWDLKHVKHLKDYEAYIERLRIGRVQRYVAYMHFSHTHFPVDLDGGCQYRGDDRAWVESAQDRAGLEGEALCGLRQTARLLERLKELGVYDNTMLVLKSDHGQPASFYDMPPHNLRINEHPLWGYDRYRPMLLLKNRGQRFEAPRHSDDLVTLGDLARTICLHWDRGGARCADFPGVDLLGARHLDESPELYLNVVKDAKSDYTYDTHKTVKLARGTGRPGLLEQLEAAAEVELSPSEQRIAW